MRGLAGVDVGTTAIVSQLGPLGPSVRVTVQVSYLGSTVSVQVTIQVS